MKDDRIGDFLNQPAPRNAAAVVRERIGQVTAQVAGLTAAGVKPRLAVVTATDDASSAWYVSSLSRAAANVGITCDVVDCGADAATDTIRAELDKLSDHEAVHGILLQTPLPHGA